MSRGARFGRPSKLSASSRKASLFGMSPECLVSARPRSTATSAARSRPAEGDQRRHPLTQRPSLVPGFCSAATRPPLSGAARLNVSQEVFKDRFGCRHLSPSLRQGDAVRLSAWHSLDSIGCSPARWGHYPTWAARSTEGDTLQELERLRKLGIIDEQGNLLKRVDRSSKKGRDFGGWGWCSATCASSLAAIASGKTGLFFRAARAEEQLDACNVDHRSAEIDFGGPVEVGARARHRHSHGRTPGGYSMPRPPPRYSGYGTVPSCRSGCRMGRAGRASRPGGCPLCSPSAADPPGPSVLPPPLRYAPISWGRRGSALLCQGRCRP